MKKQLLKIQKHKENIQKTNFMNLISIKSQFTFHFKNVTLSLLVMLMDLVLWKKGYRSDRYHKQVNTMRERVSVDTGFEIQKKVCNTIFKK